jgi:hypothetical protein
MISRRKAIKGLGLFAAGSVLSPVHSAAENKKRQHRPVFLLPEHQHHIRTKNWIFKGI